MRSLVDAITGRDVGRLRSLLDGCYWSRDQLTDALRLAVCVDVCIYARTICDHHQTEYWFSTDCYQGKFSMGMRGGKKLLNAVRAGADIDALLNNHVWTPEQLKKAFCCALASGHVSCVKNLVEHPFIYCHVQFIPESKLAQVKTLIKADLVDEVATWVDVQSNWPQADLNSMLFYSAMCDSVNCLKLFIDHPVTAVDKMYEDSRNTLLHIVMKHCFVSEFDSYSDLTNQNNMRKHAPAFIQAVCEKLGFTKRDPQDWAVNHEKSVLDVLEGEQAWSPLHWAVRAGHLEAAKSLLSYGADIDSNISRYYPNHESNAPLCSPLVLALKLGDIAMATLLISCGCAMDNQQGFTLGTLLVEESPPESLEELLHVMVKAASSSHQVPSEDAFMLFTYARLDTVQLILERGLNLFRTEYDSSRQDILGWAVLGKPEYLDLCLTDNVSFPVDVNDCVLHGEDIDDADPAYLDEDGVLCEVFLTPLQIALRLKRLDTVRILFKHGVDSSLLENDSSDNLLPPICHINALNGYESLKVLLRYGCRLNDTFTLMDENDEDHEIYIIDYYIICGNLFICKLLWQAGGRKYHADLNRLEFDAWSTLQSMAMVSNITDTEVDSFRQDVLNSVPSLGLLARAAVRTILATNIEAKVEKLDVAKNLKSFLNLEELDEEQNVYAKYVQDIMQKRSEMDADD